MSYAELGRALGVSGQFVGRICRGSVRHVSAARLAELAALVGLELVGRTYPGATPLRDAGHAALLGRLRARLAPALVWRTEVPVVAIAGAPDQRAWDATISGDGWLVGVEAETRVSDFQALERRLALKRRDGGLDVVVLLLNDTAHHQRLLASLGTHSTFPTSARVALLALGRGSQPPGSAIVSL